MRAAVFLLLLTCGESLADQPRDQNEDLHDAARRGDVRTVKALLRRKVDVNARNRFGATALWFASYKNHPEVIKTLLAHKADPDLADLIWNFSPLAQLANDSSLASFELLLQAKPKGADPLLLQTASAGQATLVAAILRHHRPSADILSTALTVTGKDAKAVREHLTKAGARPFPAASEDEQKQAKPLAGRFESAIGQFLLIEMRDGVLIARSSAFTTGFAPSALRPVEGLIFRVVGDESARIRFELRDGKVVRVNVSKGKTDTRFEPLQTIPTAKPGKYTDPPAVVRAAANWPSFRGIAASGVADGQHPPGVWDLAKPHARTWKTPIPGLGHSCPIVWGDKVFVTTAVSSDPKSELKPGQYGAVGTAKDRTKHTWKVYCLDRKSGKILWERTACEGVPRVLRHTKATHANATPTTDGKRLIVSFASEGMYCYDLSGKLLWKVDLGLQDAGFFSDPEVQWESASSPILYGDLVIVQCDRQKESYLAAFHADTGKPAWKTSRDEIPSWGTPTLVESKTGAELVTNGTNAVRGYDPKTGKQLWQLRRNSQITVPTPIVGDGLIFVTSGYRPIQPIYAIWPGARGDITLKEGEESNKEIAWSKGRGGPYMPTPIYYRGHLYVCGNGGQLTCYEGRTGKLIYRRSLSGSLGFTASPVAADGRLYFTGESGQVHVVKAGPEFELLATNELGDTCLACPAIADGTIFFRTQKYLIGIGRRGDS